MKASIDELKICDFNSSYNQHRKKTVDYKNKVCIKPWGSEYLLYESKQIAIWVMSIRKGMSTSVHLHFKKDTIMIVLNGCVKIHTYTKPYILSVMDKIFIEKKAFHGVEALSDGVTVLEIEVFSDGLEFSDKNDLLRIRDSFHRDKTGYESSVETHESENYMKSFVAGNTNVQFQFNSNAVYNILLDGKVFDSFMYKSPGSMVTTPGECLSILCNDFNESRKILYTLENLHSVIQDKKIVLTSGCFDIIHKGHMKCLREAKKLGDLLVVCMSSDAQIKRLKGSSRPVNKLEDRIEVLKSISYVDYILVYDETDDEKETTLDSIMTSINPHVWVKGSEYDEMKIRTKHPVLSNIKLIEMESDISTTKILSRSHSKYNIVSEPGSLTCEI